MNFYCEHCEDDDYYINIVGTVICMICYRVRKVILKEESKDNYIVDGIVYH